MGMDVFGTNPTGEDGKYFRNNVWWWRPLWDYACDCAGIDDELRATGHYNEGAGLDAEGAIEMAESLREALELGQVDEFECARNRAIENAEEILCELCKGSGIRIWEGNNCPCNGCDETGKVKPDWTEYAFESSNVEAFVRFLEQSGGFSIH